MTSEHSTRKEGIDPRLREARWVIVPSSGADRAHYERSALEEFEISNGPALNAQKVRELLLPLPPMAEQHEILRRVDALLTMAGSASGHFDHLAGLTNQTSQALLGRWLRGELLEVAV